MVRGRCRSTPALPTTEESESETGLDPEVAAEIEQIPDELQQIVDGALAYFAVPEDGVLHLCPHPSASPAGGQTWPTPQLGHECWCEPGVTYDTVDWESPPWKMIGFAKTDRHLFHYNFRASNELEGYGACSFTAQAFANLDHDDIFSTYERRGHVDENGSVVEALFVNLPYE